MKPCITGKSRRVSAPEMADATLSSQESHQSTYKNISAIISIPAVAGNILARYESRNKQHRRNHASEARGYISGHQVEVQVIYI